MKKDRRRFGALPLLMLAVVPPIVVGTVWFGKRIRRMSKAVQDELATVSGHVQESIGAIQTVQSFVREAEETRRYDALLGGVVAAALARARVRAAFFGVVGFVGLVAPHAARALVGASHRLILPAAMLLGAVLVCLGDLIGRTAIAPAQLPAGLLTALLGAPYFVYLLFRSRRSR